MTEQAKISICLSTGEVTIEAPSSALGEIFDRLESFVPRLREIAQSAKEHESQTAGGDSSEGDAQPVVKAGELATGASKKSKAGKGSSGKPESYKAVDLKLTQDQRAAFKEFYNSKAPETQNDHILVVMYWLLQNTDREKVTMDEIFTGLRTVDAKIPKRISSVLSNLAIGAYISKENSEPKLLHVGEDHVLHNLPKKKG